MNEFEPCPECKIDLLLEDPESEGKGLKCLECGYTCLATEPQAISSSEVSSNKLDEKVDYWKRRCEAAERVIESLNTNNEGLYFITHKAWFEIKEDGEPT